MIVMPLPRIQRSELWVVDLGYMGKTRPALVVNIPFLDHERTLCIIVPHTTSIIGTRFEVEIQHAGLAKGVFDIQQITAIPAAKFVRKIGALNPSQMRTIETILMRALDLKPDN
jgi:mRNA interferase MazF